MKILIIRHGDPDYKNDSLTEKGRTVKSLHSRPDSANATMMIPGTIDTQEGDIL